MEVLERLTPYVELVHLLLNTNFTYLTRKLAPSDSLDRARIPSAVAKSYDEVLFGGVLFDCVPGIPCEIKTPFGICFTALALWKGDGFVLIGPYLPERADGAQLEEILASQGVPLGLKEQYGVYYRDLPTLSRGKVRAALGVLAAGVYGESLASSAFSSRDISPEDPSPCPVFEEDSMQVRADAIARRYEGERRLMEAVARGDMRAADMVEETTLRLERVPNKLRNRKNLFIVLNTLMRKAVEAAQVHPFYIDAISAKWAMRIEAVEQEADLYPMRREIVEDYCRLAQTRSMASYSPNVRSMLTYVQFNFAEGISLEAIARQLGERQLSFQPIHPRGGQKPAGICFGKAHCGGQAPAARARAAAHWADCRGGGLFRRELFYEGVQEKSGADAQRLPRGTARAGGGTERDMNMRRPEPGRRIFFLSKETTGRGNTNLCESVESQFLC